MAEHANEKKSTNNDLPGLTAERVKAGVTIVVTLYALANAGLSLAGINPLPFTDEQVSASVFGVIGIVVCFLIPSVHKKAEAVKE